MLRLNAKIVAGLALLTFSIIFLLQSLKFPYLSKIGPGAGFFPTWLSSIMLVLSILYIIESLLGKNDSSVPLPRGKALINILFILGNVVLYIILVSTLGFVITTSIFLFSLFYRGYKWYLNIVMSLGISVFLFWVFGSVLGVALPINGFGW